MSTLADRIDFVVKYIDGERTPITGTPLDFLLDDLARLSMHNPNWPYATRDEWEIATRVAIEQGKLIESHGNVWIPKEIKQARQGELF